MAEWLKVGAGFGAISVDENGLCQFSIFLLPVA
jgi:hypothetical protein